MVDGRKPRHAARLAAPRCASICVGGGVLGRPESPEIEVLCPAPAPVRPWPDLRRPGGGWAPRLGLSGGEGSGRSGRDRLRRVVVPSDAPVGGARGKPIP